MTWMTWSIAFGAALGLATAAAAGLVPGSGPARTNCFVELDVAGVSNPSAEVARHGKITCTDGSACDAGACGDDLCTFGVRVCWNQSDPNVACTAPARLLSVRAKGLPAGSLPPTFEGSSCAGSFADVVVPARGNGDRPGKARLRLVARAPKGTRPRTDVDVFTFVCRARAASCPTTTTTTAVPPSTTTSTTTSTSTTTTTGAPCLRPAGGARPGVPRTGCLRAL